MNQNGVAHKTISIRTQFEIYLPAGAVLGTARLSKMLGKVVTRYGSIHWSTAQEDIWKSKLFYIKSIYSAKNKPPSASFLTTSKASMAIAALVDAKLVVRDSRSPKVKRIRM